MNTHPCTLTKTLDEADDTSPAPFGWHFHGAESQKDMDTAGGMEKNGGTEEECDTGRGLYFYRV